MEADGSITLLGRGSIVINSGGEKIFPEEVESSVRSHPDVMDAIVCGAPDERWGQTVAAIVQPRVGHEAPSLESLQEHCRQSIAGYKLPRRLYVVDAVERSPSGKPDYTWAAAVVNAWGGGRGRDSRRVVAGAELSPQQRLGGRNGGARPATDPTSTEPARSGLRFADHLGYGHSTPDRATFVLGAAPGGGASRRSAPALLLASGPLSPAGAATPARGPPTSTEPPRGPSITVTPSEPVSTPPASPSRHPISPGSRPCPTARSTGSRWRRPACLRRHRERHHLCVAANTGAILWSTHVGTPVPSGDLPCGDIIPTVGSPAHR